MMHIEINPMMYIIASFALIVVLVALYRKGDVSAHFKWWGVGFSFEAKEKQQPQTAVIGKSAKP